MLILAFKLIILEINIYIEIYYVKFINLQVIKLLGELEK